MAGHATKRATPQWEFEPYPEIQIERPLCRPYGNQGQTDSATEQLGLLAGNRKRRQENRRSAGVVYGPGGSGSARFAGVWPDAPPAAPEKRLQLTLRRGRFNARKWP